MQKLRDIRLAYVLALLLSCAGAPAQTSQEQKASPPQPPVKFNLMILDKQSRAIEDVRLEELEVFEDEIKQTVTSFARDTRPLSYGLLVDCSGSMRSQFKSVIDTAQAIIKRSDDKDETLLVRFLDSENIQFVHEPTSDKAALLDAIDGFYIEGGTSAIVDAVYLSATKMAEQRKGTLSERRRALVLITDGEERGSFYKTGQLMNLLRESDIQVFAIGFVNESERKGNYAKSIPRETAVGFLTRLAEETGGRAFFPESAKDLPRVTDELMRSLHTQFIVGYTPAANPNSKPYRQLKVKLIEAPGREPRTVVARAGYTAARK
ncbi:MAG TPA: VWA domain-containing protein [Pyrinomonadaceae bacterium]|jgi:Ca-activated chloride channel family protein